MPSVAVSWPPSQVFSVPPASSITRLFSASVLTLASSPELSHAHFSRAASQVSCVANVLLSYNAEK